MPLTPDNAHVGSMARQYYTDSVDLKTIMKLREKGGWRDGSMVEALATLPEDTHLNTFWVKLPASILCRLLSYGTPVPKDLMPSSGLFRHQLHTQYTDIYPEKNTHANKINNYILELAGRKWERGKN